jgi:hypothetical protein
MLTSPTSESDFFLRKISVTTGAVTTLLPLGASKSAPRISSYLGGVSIFLSLGRTIQTVVIGNFSFTCAIGYYGAVPPCSPCDPGYFCPGNTSQPIFCPAGLACLGGIEPPSVCPMGTICLGGVSASTICPQGYYCASPATAAVICPIGYYCPAGTVDPFLCPVGCTCGVVTGAIAFTQCPAGLYSSGSNGISIISLFVGSMPVAVKFVLLFLSCLFFAASMDCLICPVGSFVSSVGASACTFCPQNMICLYGFPVALKPSFFSNRDPVQQQITTNPYPDEINVPADALKSTTTSILSLMGLVILTFVLVLGLSKETFFGLQLQRKGSIVAKSSHSSGEEQLNWRKFDFLYDAAHAVPEGKTLVVYKTSLGGLMSILSIILVLLLAILLACQNSIVPEQSSTVSTGTLPFEPFGTFKLVVTVYGNGFQYAGNCANRSITLKSTNNNDWSGKIPPVPIPNIYDITTSSCTLTWICEQCQMASSFVSPRFVVP